MTARQANSPGHAKHAMDPAAPDDKPLFCYGILMFPRILQAALGRVPRQSPASLTDYARFGLPHPDDQIYAAIAPRAGSRVPGCLLHELTLSELQLLDRIEEVEAGYYQRSTVLIRCDVTQRLVPAWTYLAASGRIPQLRGDWLPERFDDAAIDRFLRDDLPRYLK